MDMLDIDFLVNENKRNWSNTMRKLIILCLLCFVFLSCNTFYILVTSDEINDHSIMSTSPIVKTGSCSYTSLQLKEKDREMPIPKEPYIKKASDIECMGFLNRVADVNFLTNSIYPFWIDRVYSGAIRTSSTVYPIQFDVRFHSINACSFFEELKVAPFKYSPQKIEETYRLFVYPVLFAKFEIDGKIYNVNLVNETLYESSKKDENGEPIDIRSAVYSIKTVVDNCPKFQIVCDDKLIADCQLKDINYRRNTHYDVKKKKESSDDSSSDPFGGTYTIYESELAVDTVEAAIGMTILTLSAYPYSYDIEESH